MPRSDAAYAASVQELGPGLVRNGISLQAAAHRGAPAAAAGTAP